MPNINVQPVRVVTTTETFFAGFLIGGFVALMFAYGLIPALFEKGTRKVRGKN